MFNKKTNIYLFKNNNINIKKISFFLILFQLISQK